MEDARADIERLAGMITDARRAVVFTGAGISTESGIPDFRSPTGIWSQTTPIYYQEFLASEDARIEAWRRKLLVDRDIVDATPNRGHRAVAKLVRIGKVSSVITQNIDNLHQDSGVPKEKVIELHGNGSYAKCVACGTRYELAPIKEAFERDSVPPACTLCGAPVKTATISFGQAMPEDEMKRAKRETLVVHANLRRWMDGRPGDGTLRRPVPARHRSPAQPLRAVCAGLARGCETAVVVPTRYE